MRLATLAHEQRTATLLTLAHAALLEPGAGAHRSTGRGAGTDFADHKPYAPGDDLRMLDWRLAARSDRLVVRQYESQRPLRAAVVVDGRSAGAAASDVVTGVFAVLANGLAGGAVARISFCYGAGDELGVRRNVRQLLALGAALSLACALIGLLAEPIGSLIMPAGRAREEGTRFLEVMAMGGFGTIYVALSVGVLRAWGDSIRPLLVVAVMSLTTLGLEFVVILGLFGVEPRGVVAAAWITVVVRGLAAASLVFMVARHASLLPPKGERYIHWATLRDQLSLGLTAALQQVVRLLGLLVLIGITAVRYGPTEYAAVNIWIKLDLPILLTAFAWSGAVAPLVGMGLGAKRPAYSTRAAWSGVGWAALASVGGTVTVLTFSGAFATAIVPDAPDAAGLTRDILLFVAPAYFCLSTGIVVSGAFNGAGDMRSPLIWDLIVLLAIQSALALFLARPMWLGLAGLGVAVLVSRCLQGLVPVLLMRRAGWLRGGRARPAPPT